MIKMLLAHLSNALLISSSYDKSREEDKAGKMIITNYISYIIYYIYIYYRIILFSSPAVMIKAARKTKLGKMFFNDHEERYTSGKNKQSGYDQ